MAGGEAGDVDHVDQGRRKKKVYLKHAVGRGGIIHDLLHTKVAALGSGQL